MEADPRERIRTPPRGSLFLPGPGKHVRAGLAGAGGGTGLARGGTPLGRRGLWAPPVTSPRGAPIWPGPWTGALALAAPTRRTRGAGRAQAEAGSPRGAARLSLLYSVESADLVRRSCFPCLEISSEILTLKRVFKSSKASFLMASPVGRSEWLEAWPVSHQLGAGPPETADRCLQSHRRQKVTKGPRLSDGPIRQAPGSAVAQRMLGAGVTLTASPRVSGRVVQGHRRQRRGAGSSSGTRLALCARPWNGRWLPGEVWVSF